MSVLRFIVILLAILFICLCGWAYLNGDFMKEFDRITDFPWGKVTLADLVLGFVLISIIILAFEPIWIGLPVVICLFIFGNWVSAIWLAARLPKIIRKMRGVA